MTDQERDDYLKAVGQHVNELGQALQSHQYILQAMTASMKEMESRLPPPTDEPVEEPQQGETRGQTTAYKLPNGAGTLVVYMKPDSNTIVVSVRTGPHAPKLKVKIKGE